MLVVVFAGVAGMFENSAHVRSAFLGLLGGGSGFGRLTSEMAAARGARIVAADVDGEAVAATVIDTPWAVTISDITVRATGEDYVL